MHFILYVTNCTPICKDKLCMSKKIVSSPAQEVLLSQKMYVCTSKFYKVKSYQKN